MEKNHVPNHQPNIYIYIYTRIYIYIYIHIQRNINGYFRITGTSLLFPHLSSKKNEEFPRLPWPGADEPVRPLGPDGT